MSLELRLRLWLGLMPGLRVARMQLMLVLWLEVWFSDTWAEGLLGSTLFLELKYTSIEA